MTKDARKNLIEYLSTKGYSNVALMSYPYKKLKNILTENRLVDDYKFYLSTKQKPLYMVDVVRDKTRQIIEFEAENKIDAVNNLQAKGYMVNKIVLKHGHHYCRCCGKIATGTSYDLLCKECQDKYHVKKYVDVREEVS